MPQGVRQDGLHDREALALGRMAAVGFAGLLVVIMKSDEVRGILTDLVRQALSFGG